MSLNPSTIIRKADEYLNQNNHREQFYSFLRKFSQCEVYCRPVLAKYLQPDGIRPEDVGLDAKTIKDAFSESGIYFEDEGLIYKVFGAEDKPGISSCRWLRNKALHELMNRAIREICERNDDLCQYMDDFISEIENQS